MKLSMVAILAVISSQPFANIAHADVLDEPTQFELETEVVSQSIQEVPTPESTLASINSHQLRDLKSEDAHELLGPLSQDDLNTIINLGKGIWSVIENNKPVVNTTFDYANGLPKGVTSADDLSGFSDLVHTSYKAVGKNIFGGEVYHVVFTLVHQYGGTVDGKGKYLATVAVIPSYVKVGWGNKLNFIVKHVNTLNVGTLEAPIASVNLQLTYEVQSLAQFFSKTVVYQFRGDRELVTASELIL